MVTLAGRLELRGRACERFEDGRPAATATVVGSRGQWVGGVRGERLLLQSATPVVLASPLEVLVGSRESERGVRLRRLRKAVALRLTGAIDAVGLDESLHFRSLRHGDRVWVRGRLARSDTAELDTDSGAGETHEGRRGGTYRTPATQWQLRPATEDGRVWLAYAGTRTVSPINWARSLAAGMVGVLSYFGAGKLAISVGAYEIAAASHLRHDALDHLRAKSERSSDVDPTAIDRVEALSRLQGDPCGLVWWLRKQGHLDRARRVAAECRDEVQVGDIARCSMRRGRFADASATLELISEARPYSAPEPNLYVRPSGLEPDLHVGVHLLAGNARRALERLEYLAWTESRVPSNVLSPEGMARSQCLRAALRVRLDRDRAALRELRERSRAPVEQLACTLLYADLVPGEERLRALDDCTACRTSRGLLADAWLLGVGAACPLRDSESERCGEWLRSAETALPPVPLGREHLLESLGRSWPALEADACHHLRSVRSMRWAQGREVALTWCRARSELLLTATSPGSGRVEELLEGLAESRDRGQALPPLLGDELGTLLHAAHLGRLAGIEPLHDYVWIESGTCNSPYGWYVGQMDPQLTLAHLLRTAATVDPRRDPEFAGEIWLAIAAFREALVQRELAVPLRVLHLPPRLPASTILVEWPVPLDLAHVELKMERRPCDGECPVYTVVVRGDGRVSYRGVRWVKEVGTRDASIPERDVKALLGTFQQAEFLRMPADGHATACSSVPGHASVELTVTAGGRSKVVEHDLGWECPESALFMIEEAFDRLAKTRVWTGRGRPARVWTGEGMKLDNR